LPVADDADREVGHEQSDHCAEHQEYPQTPVNEEYRQARVEEKDEPEKERSQKVSPRAH
jgi:hypothetical protein